MKTRSKGLKNVENNILEKEISNIMKVNDNDNVIVEHFKKTKHNFDWKNFKILDHEPSFGKRRISEMLHINIQDDPLNKKEDSQQLFKPYLHSLHKMRRKNLRTTQNS